VHHYLLTGAIKNKKGLCSDLSAQPLAIHCYLGGKRQSIALFAA
jgi:hypothetical protein